VTDRPIAAPAGPAPLAGPARLGLIVNPIAGMGGRVGLKGTDGPTLQRAIALGARPVAPDRGREVVAGITVSAARLRIAIDVREVTPESATGTQAAAAEFRDTAVDLLLFVGGDGTARDVCAAIGMSVPVLGVPAGVKMHSAVFALGTRTAADIAVAWLASGVRRTREAEVVDIDEVAMQDGVTSVRLYGTLLVPDVPGRIQALKAAGGVAASAEVDALAREVVRRLAPGTPVVLGPGTTTRAIGRALGLETTLLGVDVVEIGPGGGATMVVRDAGEGPILASLRGRSGVAVISPTGGQGFLIGRGNQQLSPAVIRAIGPANLIVVATLAKLAALEGRPLYVDSGDPDLDSTLAGHRRVITGRGQETVMRIDRG